MYQSVEKADAFSESEELVKEVKSTEDTRLV